MRTIYLILSIILLFGCKSKNSPVAPQVIDSEVPSEPLNHEEVKEGEFLSERWKATSYRNENWHPEQGQYFFSESWTWTYFNEFVESDDVRYNGEMTIYVDPPSGTILLERNATRYSGDMMDWMIVDPEGVYIAGYTDERGRKIKREHQLGDLVDLTTKLMDRKEDFDRRVKYTGEYKIFGDDRYAWPTVHGEEYRMTYEKTSDENYAWATSVPFSTRPFYLAHLMDGDIVIPISMPYGYIWEEDMLALADEYQYGEKKMGYKLKQMNPDTYFLDISAYANVLSH